MPEKTMLFGIGEALTYAGLNAEDRLEILGKLLAANFVDPLSCASLFWDYDDDANGLTWAQAAADVIEYVEEFDASIPTDDPGDW